MVLGYAKNDIPAGSWINEHMLDLPESPALTDMPWGTNLKTPVEKPTKHGLIFAATPASDIVCGPSQVASGIGLQVFMTGRGTPYGLDVAPVIKVCSRNEVQEIMQWLHNHEGGQKDHSAIAQYYEYLTGIQIGR